MSSRRILFSVCAVLIFSVAAFGQNYSGATTTFPGCGNPGCHNTAQHPEFPQWQGTVHAMAYDSAAAIVQQSSSCLQCHTTGWDPTKNNLGADDFVTVDTTKTTFNVTVDNPTEFAKKTNVQCESCHGPTQFGVNHPPDVSNITAQTCGQCHQDEHHPYIEEWSMSKHAISDTNASAFLTNSFRNNPNCTGCHTVQGFIQFVGTTPADSSNIVPNVAEPPGDDAMPIGCFTCHDPHDRKHAGQLRLPVEQLCVKCHNPEDAQPPEFPHHSTSSMWDGVGAVEFAGVTYRKQSVHQLVEPARSRKCATCHVYMTPFDPGPPVVPAATGHTFYPRLEACSQCHTGGLPDFNYKGRQTTIDSLLTIVAGILANASPADSMTDAFQNILFNYRFADSEGSRGVHNFNYAYDILTNTINYADTTLTSTAVADRDGQGSGLPQTFVLQQNYPNPFNPSTTIRFAVPKTAQVRLVVYDAAGVEVAVLVDGRLTAKEYEVEFNATDLPTGLYFYRLSTDGGIALTQKMILVK